MILNIEWILLILSLAFCNHIQVEEKIYAGFGCLKGFPYRFQDAAGGRVSDSLFSEGGGMAPPP